MPYGKQRKWLNKRERELKSLIHTQLKNYILVPGALQMPH